MPISICKDCGIPVSTSATVCPKCGSIDPAVRVPLQLTITRNKGFMGFAAKMNFFVDGIVEAQLQNGESKNIEIMSGRHSVHAVFNSWGGAYSDVCDLEFEPNYRYKIILESVGLSIKFQIAKEWNGGR